MIILSYQASWLYGHPKSLRCLPLPAALLGQLLLGLLLGVALGFLAVNEVEALGLDLAVDECADDAREDLLGRGVLVGVA